MGARRIIAARACDELPDGAIANLASGCPRGSPHRGGAGAAGSFDPDGRSGPIGGNPGRRIELRVSLHPQAIVDHRPSSISMTAEAWISPPWARPRSTPSATSTYRSSARVWLAWAIVNITQTAKKVVFCGTFTTDGLEIAIADGLLRIVSEGRVPKFVEQVEQVSFSARRARQIGQEVLYVTERRSSGRWTIAWNSSRSPLDRLAAACAGPDAFRTGRPRGTLDGLSRLSHAARMIDDTDLYRRSETHAAGAILGSIGQRSAVALGVAAGRPLWMASARIALTRPSWETCSARVWG